MDYCGELRCFAAAPCADHQQTAQVVKGAVITDYKLPPSYQDTEVPAPDENQVQVRVLAAGLHPLVKARASGAHYSGAAKLPLVPGVDGVGYLPSGELVYFMAMAPKSSGSFAARATVLKADCLPLPAHANPQRMAGLVNPAMPVWLALRRRAQVKPGFSVLIMGVTGNAGQMGLHLCKLLGASRVVGVARNQQTMNNLMQQGLDAAIPLGDDDDRIKQQIAQEAAGVDVVLDFLWGHPAELAMGSILTHRKDSTQRLSWVQCGSMAGPNINLPAGLMRSTDFQLIGTGLGPLSWEVMRTELTELVKVLAAVELPMQVDVVPLSQVESTWNKKESERVVFSME